MASLAEAPSPTPSSHSSGEDFVALLEAELDSYENTSSATDDVAVFPSDKEQIEDELWNGRNKRQRIEMVNSAEQEDSNLRAETSGSDIESFICPPHPGFFKGLCVRCGKLEEDDGSAVAFGYIHKDLKLGTSELDRLRGADLKNLLRDRKLILVLDLDHTLINSTRLSDVHPEEQYLLSQLDDTGGDAKRSLYRLGIIDMLTKLRPFVHTFLKEASHLFEMYVYTMAERPYALEIVKLLDPENAYFPSKVITQSDCTQRHQKGLDVVLGAESAVVILDDTEFVWQKHRDNLILMERYHYFTSSCQQHGSGHQSFSVSRIDENEYDGALSTILNVLKRAHQMFFDPAPDNGAFSKDIREVLKKIRQEILHGCKIVFSRVFPSSYRAEEQSIWKTAELLGATCCKEVDPSITHVVALVCETQKAHWAQQAGKILVHPRWIMAAYYRWQRQKESDFPVAPEAPK